MVHSLNYGSAGRSYLGAVAVVASAGGIPALIDLLGGLAADFPLPIFVAQHLPRTESVLDRVLSSHCRLPVQWARAGEYEELRGVYLAMPGTGVRVTEAGIAIDELALPSASWLPSGDRMIESVFSLFGSRTIAIVLSGMLPAGVNGLRAVRKGGGITIAQAESSATDFDMPSAAIDFGKAEIICSPRRMAGVLTALTELWREADAAAAENTVALRDRELHVAR